MLEEVKLSLRVMINKEKTKVLFAEADSYFVDELLSFLTLPLGKIVKILENHYKEKAPIIGSLTTLYRSISNLDSVYSWQKSYLLNPTSSSEAKCFKLKLNVEATRPAMKYTQREDSEYCKRKRSQNVYMRKASKSKAQASKSKAQATDDDGDAGVFAINTASFIITDDLRIAPVVPGSLLQTLMNIGITDTDGAELSTVIFGFNEIKDLLGGSLVSETPLTDIILHKSRKKNCVTEDFLHKMEKKPSSNSKKMFVKAMVQKSTNKLLIAQAEEDFIEFLFSILIIPLGAFERLLGSNTCLKNIDNLYRSIATVIGDKYLKTKDTKTMLLKPKIDHVKIPQNQILPLVEEGWSSSNESLFSKYVKGPAMYNVTDDLTVTPFCLTSSVSILNGLKIPLSDVKEMDLQIGLEEALSILKASLTSTSALTNGLVNPILQKQPKQESRV